MAMDLKLARDYSRLVDLDHALIDRKIFYDPDIYQISIHSAVDLYMSVMRVVREGTTTRGEEVGHCNIPVLYEKFDDALIEKIEFSGRYFRAHESLPT